MISKEQIAHDLSMLYLYNRYGVDVSGSISTTDGNVRGNICTEHLPDMDKVKYVRVGTGVKGFLGLEKKKTIEAGIKVNDTFISIVSEYYKAYAHFIIILENIETGKGNIDPGTFDMES